MKSLTASSDTPWIYLNALIRSPLSLLQTKQAQLSQCLCIREMLQTPHHLCGLCWTLSSEERVQGRPQRWPVLRYPEPDTKLQNWAVLSCTEEPRTGHRTPEQGRSLSGAAPALAARPGLKMAAAVRAGTGPRGGKGPAPPRWGRPAPPDGFQCGGEGPQPDPAMSGAAEARELEERLREAAALGDVAEVRRLLGAGADIDSRNEINGWWGAAASRGVRRCGGRGAGRGRCGAWLFPRCPSQWRCSGFLGLGLPPPTHHQARREGAALGTQLLCFLVFPFVNTEKLISGGSEIYC